MEPVDKYKINLWGHEELELRLGPLKALMRENGMHHALVRNNANIYYLTGRVFRGFIYINVDLDTPYYFVRQPNHLTSDYRDRTHHIRKPEEIPALLTQAGIDISYPLALELDSDSYAEAVRLAASFGQTPEQNFSHVIRQARSVKTACEIEMIRESGIKQSLVYEQIPHLFKEGMTDIEFQIEIERALRLEGCLGQFRIGGSDMELYMGNLLTGENADTPSPYDFAMGGEGQSPSLPVGANGTLIRPDMPVMVDMNGNFNGYMTDMTRMYISGAPTVMAEKANRLSIAICDTLSSMMAPGVKASDLYAKALDMATEAGMAEYFMGHRSHAGFVGHGIGIEVNELPVIAPRSRDVLQAGNVIALEPKFVIPGLGAVGIENTYIVGDKTGATAATTARTDFIRLD